MSASTPPPDGSGPELLEQSGGDRVRPASSGGNGRRTALVAGGVVAALAAAGVGTWAAVAFLGSGADPSEALPAGTVAYASVDLDPSGSQKVEAFRMLNKFPAFKQEFGLDADDDVRRQIAEESLAGCDAVDFGSDIEPWLGTSFAVAAVDTGAEQPSPVFVAGVTDTAAAEDGLAALAECGGEEQTGWSIEGDWAVVAESDEIAQQVTDAAAEATLADDAEFQEWTSEAGDPGVATLYAAPEAGPLLGDLLAAEMAGSSASDVPPEEVQESLSQFAGAAATIRFDDATVELEAAGGVASEPVFDPGADGVGVVTSLPDDTAVALGLVFAEGWGQRLVDQMAAGGAEGDQLLAQAEQMTGLSLPEDLETLLGDSLAVAVSGDFSLETATGSSDGSDVPIGVKVQGDASGVQEVLDRLTARWGPGGEQVLGSDADDDTVAVGPSADYRSALLADGGLGDTSVFQDVVPEAESSSAVAFVNFEAGGWLDSLAQTDPAAEANLDPLEAFGASVWHEDETTHGLIKLTTD